MANQYLSADDFLVAIRGSTVDFDTGSGIVKLRGLNVTEVKEMQARQTTGGAGVDTLAMLVGYGLVEPRLTEDEAAQLSSASFDLINTMAQRVMALTGLAQTTEQREALDS